MRELFGSEKYCMYRGTRYMHRTGGTDPASGQDFVILVRSEGDSVSDFPDAISFKVTQTDFLVKLPRKFISREWSEDIWGEWKGVEFHISLIPGNDEEYSAFSIDPAAADIGIRGDQYHGWWGVIPACEVTYTRMRIREKPTSIPYAVMRQEDVIDIESVITDEGGSK